MIVQIRNGYPLGDPQGIPSSYGNMTSPRIEDMLAAGWAEYVAPEYDPATQKLGDYIPAAGGAWTREVINLLPPELDAVLAGLKAAKQDEINTAYSTAVDAATAGYPPEERDTFTLQAQEALAWMADNAASVPLISAIAAGRGVTVAQLVPMILGNAQSFAAGIGYYTGHRQRLRDQIAAATTAAQVEAITWG